MTETTEENDIKKRMEIADLICEENRELKSKLSNRDKEIEKIKEAICVQDTDAVTWIKGIEKIRFDIESSLQSKEGEEE